MAMFSVIPTKKSLTESSAVLNAPETARELRPILQSAELAFRIRIVVRDVRPTVCLGHSQIGQQKRDRFGAHRGAPIRMQGELTGLDVLFVTTFLDQPLGQLRAFAISHHPAGNIPTEDIEDYVEIAMPHAA